MAARGGRAEVLECPLDVLDMRATVDRCMALAESADGPSRQVSINAAKVVECHENRSMRRFVRDSDVVSADGQSVVWAARLLGHRIPERVPGIDLMQELLAGAAERGFTVYLLGAREDTLHRALQSFEERYPGLRIAGARNGYFEPREEAEIAARIREANPDVLFVAMPSPYKEQFLDRHLERIGVRFAMGVGGAIDVLAGERARAPRWMQRLGLEWLFRLAQEPSRMWRRYLVRNLKFVCLVARELVRPRGRSQARAS
jgi:N-acetylglucosaminyldiphosphoundecaprenol N-acetyl-beta-D-mannosaminyltransferase